mmetsp:Transcript_21350/g.33015  ORF Transcript_21350/g.33015 Transcript_21350/m.33015 type:complete len:433 (+) Transcript_21350:1027-2325(+)
MQSIQFIRQKTIVKLAITLLFIKVAFFHVTSIIDDGTSSEELEYKEDWTPQLGEQLGLTQKEYRVKRRQYRWRRKQGGGSTLNLFGGEQKVENDDITTFMNDNYGGYSNDVNIPRTMGYYNLSCPFEWYKYSCAFMQDNEFDEQITAASVQYYQQNLAEIQRAFDSVFNDQINPQQKPKRIFMTGDSLLRQVFISIACNAFSLNAVEQSEVQWREEWPCPEGIAKCAITGGVHSGFDAASVRFTNGMEIHYVPHGGFAYDNRSQGESDVLQRMKRQVDDSGEIDFGTKTAFPPSGPMDVLVYNVGAHFTLMKSRNMLNSFVSNIAMPLMRSKSEHRPKIVYVTTPTAHFNTTNGQYLSRKMGDEQKQCVDRVARNPRAELEKRILKAGVSVDVLLDYDDLELGALHVQRGDCLHYCMPGAADLVAARLLDSF